MPVAKQSDRSILREFMASGEGSTHKRAGVVREHGGIYVACPTCGAAWSVHDSSNGASFEPLGDGDGYCLEIADR